MLLIISIIPQKFIKMNRALPKSFWRGRGGNSFSPHPFFFPPRPSENYQKSASGFSRKKVRILFRIDSQLVKFLFPASLGASCLPVGMAPLASTDEFSSNFQTSQSFFARRANAKRQFS